MQKSTLSNIASRSTVDSVLAVVMPTCAGVHERVIRSYIESLSDQELRAAVVAAEELGGSFVLTKCRGFKEWRQSFATADATAAAAAAATAAASLTKQVVFTGAVTEGGCDIGEFQTLPL